VPSGSRYKLRLGPTGGPAKARPSENGFAIFADGHERFRLLITSLNRWRTGREAGPSLQNTWRGPRLLLRRTPGQREHRQQPPTQPFCSRRPCVAVLVRNTARGCECRLPCRVNDFHAGISREGGFEGHWSLISARAHLAFANDTWMRAEVG
jgi:hypothetical protein